MHLSQPFATLGRQAPSVRAAIPNQPPFMGAFEVNPSLLIEATFSVPFGSDRRRTKLDLKQHADVAGWLLSFLEYHLRPESMLQSASSLPEAPRGSAREKLVAAKAILTFAQPNGEIGLVLNPGLEIQLLVTARRRGTRAHFFVLGLADDPDVARWLLLRCVGAQPADLGNLPAQLFDRLCSHAILVDQLPQEDASYPDPTEPVDLAVELAPMAQVFFQPAGADLPAEVRETLGRHVPQLPAGVGLVWGQDAGTGMVHPLCWNGAPTPAEVERLTGSARTERLVQWEQQREVARQQLRAQRYAVLRDILPPAHRERLRRFVRELVTRGHFPELGDGQVQLRAAIHNQPTIASLHQGLAGVVNSICDDRVLASYSYLSCYEEGAVLERHKDRPQCAYNLSLVLDMWSALGEPDPWPIYVEIEGKPKAVLLRAGDGVAYSGTEIWHWRDALPKGQRAIVCFFHFVPEGFTGSLD